MNFKSAALLVLGLGLTPPALAETKNFTFEGVVEGSDYGAAAASDIYAVAPVGSPYTLTFSYDTSTLPDFGGPTYGGYRNVVVSAVFTLGGTAFNIPTANIATGSGEPFDGSALFYLFNLNVPFSAMRIAGYQLIDFGFLLSDPSGTALPTGALPSTFDLADFAVRSVSPRFAFGANGETRLHLSVDPRAATAVPEPASWALLLIGFGMIGVISRRQKSARA